MKLHKRKSELFLALSIGVSVATAVGVGIFLALKSKKEYAENNGYIKIDLEQNAEPDIEEMIISDEISVNPAIKTALSFDEAYEVALEAAKEQFGENGFIVPASEKEALYVNISGIKRACYMFGADKMDLIDGSMKGLYHVDADTGEVFDNGTGLMKQIRFAS